jgi:hypothetical protein
MGLPIRLILLAGLVLLAGGCANPARFEARQPASAMVRVQSAGRGFVVSPDGVIVTCQHLVADAKVITVTLPDGRQVPATLLNEDKEADVALLKVAAQEKGKEFRILHLNDEDAEPGMHVRAFAGEREVHGSFDHWEEFGRVIEFTVAAADAGSPLLADDGRVIGVVTGPFEKHSRAAPAWQVLRLMPELGAKARFGH